MTALDLGSIGARLACMCFKITPAQREYYHYRGISAEMARHGYGSSRPELAWAFTEKQREPQKSVDDQNKDKIPSSLSISESN
jgi:hypothetical protein